MITFKGKKYFTFHDLCMRWSIKSTQTQTFNNLIYRSQRFASDDPRHFPRHDATQGRTRLWSIDKAERLDHWYETITKGRQAAVKHDNGTTTTQEEGSTVTSEEKINKRVTYDGKDITPPPTIEPIVESVCVLFTRADEFPALAATHILATVDREGESIAKYFIPLEDWSHIKKHFSA